MQDTVPFEMVLKTVNVLQHCNNSQASIYYLHYKQQQICGKQIQSIFIHVLWRCMLVVIRDSPKYVIIEY